MLKEWPNTYAMTKAIAEGEILTYGKGLPIGVIRPSMSKYLFKYTFYVLWCSGATSLKPLGRIKYSY